jgi:hypothetical protein
MSTTTLKERIPFEVVVADDKLMGKLWKKLSIPQQVILKATYGLPLANDSELAAWAILCDNVKYDDLYFPTQIVKTPYEAKEYRRIVGLIGRRSGKSYVTCFAALYEVIFGGHTTRVPEGQDIVVPYIAQDLATAKKNMRMIYLLARQVKMLEAQIDKALPDVIAFKNGISVIPEPPAIKTGRGVPIPVAILDEVGFWYKTSDNANPDFEVERAVRPAMTQFPDAKMFIISSPYTEEGILWKAKKAGTGGQFIPQGELNEFKNTLVLQASTAAMANPELVRAGLKDRLEEELAADPDGFVREYGARFVTAISGFLPAALVNAATDAGVRERKREDVEKHLVRPFYMAAMDPATRHDSWAFTIFHRDQHGRLVQDVIREWKPNKKAGISLNPAAIMAEIAELCEGWRINTIYSDQWSHDALRVIANQFKLAIIEVSFAGTKKAQMWTTFLQLLRQGHLRLLDVPEMYQQLVQLQKKPLANGSFQVSAPPNRHDDLATVCAIAAKQVMDIAPRFAEIKKEKTLFDEGLENIRKRRQLASEEGVWV